MLSAGPGHYLVGRVSPGARTPRRHRRRLLVVRRTLRFISTSSIRRRRKKRRTVRCTPVDTSWDMYWVSFMSIKIRRLPPFLPGLRRARPYRATGRCLMQSPLCCIQVDFKSWVVKLGKLYGTWSCHRRTRLFCRLVIRLYICVNNAERF